jgi:MFS family permease
MKMQKMLSTYEGLPKSIYIIFFSRIVNAMGSFIYPFLTLFLTEKMKLGASTAGKFILLTAVTSVPGALLGGKLSDKFGRKHIVIIFQCLAAICFIPCGFLKDSMLVPWLLLVAFFFTSAATPAYTAMTTDLTNVNNRRNAFSLLYLGNNMGLAVGPLIAGFLYKNFISWIFWGNAISTFISLILIGVFVKESIPQSENLDKPNELLHHNEKAEEGSLFSVLLRRPALLMFAGITTIYTFVYAQHLFIIPMQVNQCFPNNGAKVFGTIMTTNALVVVFLTTPITNITKKYRPTFNMVLSGGLYAIGFGILYFINSYPLFILSTIIWSTGEVLGNTNSGVYIASNTPITHRGRFNSVIPLLTGAGFALGPFFMGMFIQNTSIKAAWAFLFSMAVFSTILMYFLNLKEK